MGETEALGPALEGRGTAVLHGLPPPTALVPAAQERPTEAASGPRSTSRRVEGDPALQSGGFPVLVGLRDTHRSITEDLREPHKDEVDASTPSSVPCLNSINVML